MGIARKEPSDKQRQLAAANPAPQNEATSVPAIPRPKPAPRLLHGVLLPGTMYRHLMPFVVGPDDKLMLDSATEYMTELMAEFKPRDPVERLLFSQTVQTHARLMYLNTVWVQQTNVKWSTMMHEAADRAANTFRRQMLALAEYRRPPSHPVRRRRWQAKDRPAGQGQPAPGRGVQGPAGGAGRPADHRHAGRRHGPVGGRAGRRRPRPAGGRWAGAAAAGGAAGPMARRLPGRADRPEAGHAEAISPNPAGRWSTTSGRTGTCGRSPATTRRSGTR